MSNDSQAEVVADDEGRDRLAEKGRTPAAGHDSRPSPAAAGHRAVLPPPPLPPPPPPPFPPPPPRHRCRDWILAVPSPAA
jgi:hypothetical protein